MDIQFPKLHTALVFQLAFVSVLAISSAIETCTSKNCKALETLIQDNINSSVDPCDDFYEYACGNFIRKHRTPPNFATVSPLTNYSLELEQRLYQLASEPESPSDNEILKAIKAQYKICLNEDTLDAAGVKPLLDIIKQNGGWPMITPNQCQPTKTPLEVQDEYNRRTGRGPLYTVHVYARTPKSSENAITLDQPYDIPRYGYNIIRYETRPIYVKYIADVAAEFAKANNVTLRQDRLMRDAQDVLNFMLKLYWLRNKEMYRKGPSMKISEAQEIIDNGTTSSLNVLSALQRLYQNVSGVTLTKDEEITLREPEYFQGLAKLLDATDPTVVLNYVQFQFAESYISLTTNSLRKLVLELYQGKPLNRTVLCSNLPNAEKALARLYVKKYLPESKIAKAKEVVEAIKAQVKHQIKQTSFIDPETRAKAIAKLNNLVTIIGYDESLNSDEKVEAYYSRYKIGKNLVENMLNYHEVEYLKKIEQLRKPIVKEEARKNSYTDPFSEVGIYAVRQNRLKLPGGLLDLPLLAEDYPPMSNFAGFGQIVGSLLAGLYSDYGPHYDDKGNIADWPSPAALAEFETRDKCFIHQYSKMTIKELQDFRLFLNTTSPVPITAPAHFALKTAYLAHRAQIRPVPYKTQNGNHVEGLGLNATIDQQFFLNFASMHCASANPLKLLPKLLFAEPATTTGRIQVNSAVSNLPEFSQVYNCAANKPMNPARKCSILD